MAFRVRINKKSCKGEGECVEACPVDVWEIGDDAKAEPINAIECVGCETCMIVCSTGSIIIEKI